MARGGGRRGSRPEVGRQRRGAGARHAIPGALLQIAFAATTDATELRRMNRRAPGAPFRLGDTVAVAAGDAPPAPDRVRKRLEPAGATTR